MLWIWHFCRGILYRKGGYRVKKKTVAILATSLNTLIAILKVTVGWLFGSMAVLADGIDSSTDILTSLTMLISIHVASQPPDEEHPYGHERAETIGAKIISFIIFYAGISLLVESTKRLIFHEYHVITSPLPLIVMALSVVIKTFLFLLEYYVGKREKSKAMMSEAMNMRNDILMSSLVFIGILLNRMGLAILDPILGILLSLFIIKTAFEIFRDSVYELMEGLPPEEMEVYTHLKNAIEKCGHIKDISRIRVRKMGQWYIVDADLKVDENLTVGDLFSLRKKISAFVKEQNPHVREINMAFFPEHVPTKEIMCQSEQGGNATIKDEGEDNEGQIAK